MPVLPQPQRMSLTDTISGVARRCNCEWQVASRAVHKTLGEDRLQAIANRIIRDPEQPRHLGGYVDTGPHRVPAKLWAGYHWPLFDRRSQPRGRAEFRERTGDGREVGPVYSNPTIATADIDAWLDRDASGRKVSESPARKEKELSGMIYEAIQIKPGAFGFAIDLKPIVERFWRRLRFRR